MKLQEAEVKLSELNKQIEDLLKERETAIKEWKIAFNTENPDKIICVDESNRFVHKLYLVKGDLKLLVCNIYEEDIKGSLQDMYRKIDISMYLLNEVNGREYKTPEYQKNLVLAKAIEIRDNRENIDA